MLQLKEPSVIFLIFYIQLNLLSCKGSVSNPSFFDQDLFGKWIVETVTTKGTVRGGAMTITVDTTRQLTDSNNYFLFYSDKCYIYVLDESALGKKTAMSEVADTGTWTLSGNELSLNSSINGSTMVVNIDIRETTLVLVMKFDADEEEASMHITATFTALKEE